MKLFVPPLRTRLKLLEPWSPRLFAEHRNYDIWAHLTAGAPPVKWNSDHFAHVTFYEGMILAVDRIYIRNGQLDFDSITFTIYDGPMLNLVSKSRGGTWTGRAPRFWVKLEDANGMEVEIV